MADRQYRLRAYVICHDVRFAGYAETVVTLPRAPTAAEATRLVWPAAEALLQGRHADGCQIEVSGVTVTPVAGG